MKDKDYREALLKSERDDRFKSQATYVEILFEPEFMDTMDSNIWDGWLDNKTEHEAQYKQALHDAIKKLTERQQRIVHLLLEGKTQWEIADTIGCTQAGIWKALYGNHVYRHWTTGEKFEKPIKHGGILKRLQILLTENQ